MRADARLAIVLQLLEILSQTKDPKAVQPHLGKCFENIVTLEFMPNLDIVAMYSGEKERVDFLAKIVPTSQVEVWLLQIEGQMRESLADMAIRCVDAYKTEKSREDWLLNWPGQMVLCGSQLYWTMEVEEALGNAGAKGLANYIKVSHSFCLFGYQNTAPHSSPGGDRDIPIKVLNRQLENVTALVRDPNLTKMHRRTIGALVTMDVHSRDVTQTMAEAGVEELNDFEWISQLRYYLEENDGRVLGVTGT